MEKHRFLSILVAVCLVVTLAFAGSLVVSAQDSEDPVVESTEEPTVEPTEEPTVEPTQEPISEPTEEPTAEPTEEPTAEPTEEPTAEPTEEPTPKPTEEPISEPITEPTPEPTEEPTAEPTVEPTATPEPTVVPEEAVGPAAFGSWTTDAIAVQNISGGSVTAQLLLYQGVATDPVQTIDLGTLAATGNAWVFPSQISTDGRYAGVVSASGAVAAAVHNYNASGAASDFYYGENNPAQVMWCPLIFGQGYSGGWYSEIHAQNATGSAQDIRIEVYVAGSTTAVVNVTENVASNASYTFDMQDASFDAFDGNYGYARVSGLSGNIAVVSDNLRVRSSAGEQMQNTYPGVPDNAAGTTLLAPLVFKTYSGNWNSGINVLNTGTSQTTVTANYTPSGDCTGCTTGTDSLTVNPGAVETFYLPSRPAPHDAWFGSVQLTSTGGNNILAVANTVKYATTGSVGYSIQAANPNNATTRVAIPMVYTRAGTGNAWISGIQVSNLGAATNITVDYVRAPNCTVGSATYSWTQSVGANSPATFSPYLAGNPLPDAWYGSAYVSSAANNNLLASVSNTGYDVGASGTWAGINYTP
jgi:hypothetical protein